MRKKISLLVTVALVSLGTVSNVWGQGVLKELLSYPYPSNLTTSTETGTIAWTFNQEGKRNIYISKDEGDSFEKITQYDEDNGQAISRLKFSSDGKWLVYMRGGEPGGNWSRGKPVNPMSLPKGTKFQLMSIRLSDHEENVLVSRPYSYKPAISPDSRRVAFVKSGNVWIAPIDGSKKAHKLFSGRGNFSYLNWSPDGEKLAFVSNRGDHSYVGIYKNNNTPIKWLDPSFARDSRPVWSPEGDSIVFIRRPAKGGAPDSILIRQPNPWEIRVADIQENSSSKIWESPNTLNGSVPTTNGKYNLHWAANDRIVFLTTQDNWPHLYSIPAGGGEPLQLTQGDFMVEYITLSPDRKRLVFSANTGPDSLDIDRRHIGLVSVDKQDMKILTPGDGLEVSPVFIDNKTISFISSNAYRPALPAVTSIGSKGKQLIGTSLLSPIYSSDNLIKPEQVIYEAPDGTPIHAMLFEKNGGSKKKPAVISIHGGPMRQMTLGWSYSSYYAAHYAVNQWLANHGYVVLWPNYRMGIGYGNNFHHPAHAGRYGASEYQDILAAGKWLANRSNIDPKRIGVYGGSYGGFLAAHALGRNSNLFTAGVDIHGVHSRVPSESYTAKVEHAPDAALADTVAWQSSPISHVENWTSPVLLIHADDDRNVSFKHSINLLNRLKDEGVDYETLVIPDDTHHLMKHSNLVRVYEATIDFLERKVKGKGQ